MKSMTYGELSFQDVCQKIKEYISSDLQGTYVISIGTDSQNYEGLTKMVSVITIVRKTKGGIFFYDIKKLKMIKDLHQKIFAETQYSLELAVKVMEFVEKNEIQATLEVHVDVGGNGDTKHLIKEIAGWVCTMGFKCCIKPESYTSSGIADRLSKRDSRVG